MNNLLWLLLDAIRETCDRRKRCEGCPCAGEYMSPTGKRYYCAIEEVPSHWQTDIIRDNIDKMKEDKE